VVREVAFRLLERHYRDRPKDDGAALHMDFEEGFVAQAQLTPDLGRNGDPSSRVHGYDASHAGVSLHDASSGGQCAN
jgi:hypothetical protein